MTRPTVDLSAHINRTVNQGGPASFPVSLHPVFYDSGERKDRVPNRLAVVREDTGKALGVVSQRYKLVRHEELLDVVQQATDKLDTGPIPRGVYVDRGGARMRALFKFPALAEPVSAGDTICPCLKLQNSYDGTSRITVHLGAFRFVCTNLAVGGGGVFAGGFMALHKGEIPIDRVAKELSGYLFAFWRIVGTYRRWSEEQLRPPAWQAVLAALPKRAAQSIGSNVEADSKTTVYRAYNAATWQATHAMRSARAAFDLMDRINTAFQEQFPNSRN
jgi:hypothetical protein